MSSGSSAGLYGSGWSQVVSVVSVRIRQALYTGGLRGGAEVSTRLAGGVQRGLFRT